MMRAFGILKYGYLTILGVGIALGGVPVDPAYGQSFPEDYEGEFYEFYDDDDPDNPENNLGKTGVKNIYQIVADQRINPTSTGSIVKALGDSYSYCSRIRQEEYRVDCIGEQLDVIAKSIPATGDYAEAREILDDASKKLRQVARANKSPSKPRVRTKGTVKGKTVVTRPLTPVRTDRVDAVNKQAANILAEAETKLLRSAESSDRRLIAYAQMAKAVGSNKTLLRSA